MGRNQHRSKAGTGANRSRGAGRLAGVLSVATEIRVDVRWDGSSRWEIIWTGGPTEASMRLLVDEFAGSLTRSFAGTEFFWSRGLPPAAWARVLIAAQRADRPVELWELRDLLDSTEYPERFPSAGEAQLAVRLVHLAGTSEHAMAQLLDQAGLDALTTLPPEVVSLHERRLRRP